MKTIEIRGAKTHNLKDVHLSLPRDKLVVITGLSGSGKSSLAFDTLYAEGQRRYVESLSAYARQFLSVMEKPDVDYIGGLSPAISIEQKATSHNPRSTVGTITEIYDYLRLLFARAGQPHCPQHGVALEAKSISQMVDHLLSLPAETKIMILAPVVVERKGEHQDVFQRLSAQGFIRARVNGEVIDLESPPALALRKKHTIEVVVDRVKIQAVLQQRLADSLALALSQSNGLVKLLAIDSGEEWLFSTRFGCPRCGYCVAELEPRLFSFNSPTGACPTCDGLGVKAFFDPQKIIHDPSLSLAAGAIRGWDRRHTYYFNLLTCLAKHYGFSLEEPFEALSPEIQKLILEGSGKQVLSFSYLTHTGKIIQKEKPFEGVVAILNERYKETDSAVIREDLARYLSTQPCQVCLGSRLREEARFVLVAEKGIQDLVTLSIDKLYTFFQQLALPGHRGEIATKIQKEILSRLGFLNDVGLNYLSLSRSAETLSGGEAQRIRLASQIGAGLVGVMYILDEPSIGLHQRDNERLLNSLLALRDMGNTVIVVEHDEDAIRAADYLVDMGPGAGIHGGEVVAQGLPTEVMANPASLTGQYLSGQREIKVPEQRRKTDFLRMLRIKEASGHNLKQLSVDIPLGLFTCVTGVSGSGKSTLINDTLYPYTAISLNGASQLELAPVKEISGLQYLDKVIDIDQSPIGRTPRSNPATYTGLFTDIRDLFASTLEARARGYAVGRFSFNVKGGRCEACEGEGLIKVEMHFLPDMYVLCDSCQGKRYNRETLEIYYKGKNIHEVLDMTIEDASQFFSAIPPLVRKLKTLMDVGLGYIKLGQSATTLSGGEAQRVKLAKELSKRDTGQTLYILDEPTTGLHFYDIEQLLKVLHRLADQGNTIVVIEHNLDVIKTADWLIDLGPEGGEGGGTLVATGTPETVADCTASHTGRFLKPYLMKNKNE